MRTTILAFATVLASNLSLASAAVAEGEGLRFPDTRYQIFQRPVVAATGAVEQQPTQPRTRTQAPRRRDARVRR